MSPNKKSPNGQIPALPAAVRDNCFRLLQEGKTTAQISEETGVAQQGTIRAWRARGKWRQAVAIAVQSERVATEENDLDLAQKQVLYQDRMSEAAIRLAEHVSRLDGEALVRSADKLLKSDTVARRALKLDKETGNPVLQIGVLIHGPGVALRNRRE